MNTLRSFIKIIDKHTLIIAGLALGATYLCRQFNFIADLPTNLIGIAVVFPLVFSLSGAYKQREDAVEAFAGIKAKTTALYYAHRDWVEKGSDHADRAKLLMTQLLAAIHAYFAIHNGKDNSALQVVYAVFSDYSRSHELLRQAGMPANEISRANQYLMLMMQQFEQMNNVAMYQPPLAIRAYSRLFLNLFPILFAPFFANVAYPEHPILGYLVAVVYSFVFVSLDNIHDNLVNPYDGIGPDDLRLDVAESYSALVTNNGNGNNG